MASMDSPLYGLGGSTPDEALAPLDSDRGRAAAVERVLGRTIEPFVIGARTGYLVGDGVTTLRSNLAYPPAKGSRDHSC